MKKQTKKIYFISSTSRINVNWEFDYSYFCDVFSFRFKTFEENKELQRRITVHIVTVCQQLFQHYVEKAKSKYFASLMQKVGNIYTKIFRYLTLFVVVSGQLPTRTIPHRTGIGPDEWFYSVVVVLVGIVLAVNSPRDHAPNCNGWALFVSGGNCPWWGVVLEPFVISCTLVVSRIELLNPLT